MNRYVITGVSCIQDVVSWTWCSNFQHFYHSLHLSLYGLNLRLFKTEP